MIDPRPDDAEDDREAPPAEAERGEPPARAAASDPVFAEGGARLAAIRAELRKLFVGQEELVDGVLAGVVARGHVLVESVPGLGKTLLVKALGRVLGLQQQRIQFTPDLMPSDITGTHVFDLAERKFVFHPGPVFSQLLLADEFNRAPAKTHSALLEVMSERQVTVDGRTHRLEPPFAVLATMNPIENEGTYALPEAQLDRFLLKVVIDYPTEAEEDEIYGLYLSGRRPEDILESELQPVTDAAGVLRLQELADRVRVERSIVDYVRRVVRATRDTPDLVLGASPRAGIALITGARAFALAAGRDYVIPDDVRDIALPALRHRVILGPEAEVENLTADSILEDVLRSIPVPRE